MSRFPRIDNPCPYRANLAAILDGDHCRLCNRDVVDLTAMSEGDRTIFLSACEGEVCVRYAVRVSAPVAAAAMAAAALALPSAAAAQDAPAPVETITVQGTQIDEDQVIIITGGGIHDPKNAKLVDNPLDDQLPGLPIVFEDERPTGKPAN